MRYLFLICLGVAACSQAVAVVDPDPDQIGLYFDEEANVFCTTVQPGGHFSLHVIITNPTSDVLEGVELSVCSVVTSGNPGSLVFNGSGWPYDCPPGYFYIDQFCEEGRVIICETPVILNGEPHIIVELSYLVYGDIEVSFFLGPDRIDEDGDGLPAYFNSHGRVPLGISSGGANLPAAQVNGNCGVVRRKHHSFGKLKALYR